MSPERSGIIELEKYNFEPPRVKAAYEVAKSAHEEKKRKSGEPYIIHPLAVHEIINKEWGITRQEDISISALLHDVVEDTNIGLSEIQFRFGNEVADLVSAVTKLENATDKDTLKKVIDKSYINPGVALIKLADRLHNMRTLEHMPQEKRYKKARETLDVYTRLAESLGMWVVKIELEDLSYKYVDNESYEKTLKAINTDPRCSDNFISNVTSRIEQILFDHSISGKVDPVRNGCWALKEKQKKMALKGVGTPDNFNSINDVLSVVVTLDSIHTCFETLDYIHENFDEKIDHDRYDEFVRGNRRVNGYQAIQTTMNFPQGPVEISLVTPEMREFNNWGLVSLIKESKDVRDYVLKLVFTPTGSIRFLPKNAVGADFACIINPRLMSEADSINVDGVQKPLTYVIPNGSTVKVNLGESRRAPLPGIEDYVLPQTRKVIQEQRILERNDALTKEGQKMMENILIPRGLLVLTDVESSINPVLYQLGCQGIDDLYLKLASGYIKQEVINRELDTANITKDKLHCTTVRISGIDQPGIINHFFKLLSEINNKNCSRIEQKNEGNNFNLRILIDDLSSDEEEKLRQSLINDERFGEVLVV